LKLGSCEVKKKQKVAPPSPTGRPEKTCSEDVLQPESDEGKNKIERKIPTTLKKKKNTAEGRGHRRVQGRGGGGRT